VVAKTGSIQHVNSLAGYIERPAGGPLVFAVLANNHSLLGSQVIRQIDSVVVELAR
jgi:D-alanyl-D-alanine carboxypeptidase